MHWCRPGNMTIVNGAAINLGPSYAVPLGSLAEFKQLKKLTIPAVLFVGHEASHDLSDWRNQRYYSVQRRQFVKNFPISVEHLDILECTTVIMECLAELYAEGHYKP